MYPKLHIDITFNGELLMNIFIYDVVNEEWIFRLDSNIRIPKNSIYFHSLTWGVDYIKPEIVLMYDLLDNQNYHQLPNYKMVLDSLSYYQFVILKVVVGEYQTLITNYKKHLIFKWNVQNMTT